MTNKIYRPEDKHPEPYRQDLNCLLKIANSGRCVNYAAVDDGCVRLDS
jgi:hypothetical protein